MKTALLEYCILLEYGQKTEHLCVCERSVEICVPEYLLLQATKKKSQKTATEA